MAGERWAGAVLSPDRQYRYRLDREWGRQTDGSVLWVMLNPSTADANADDPTIRKCVGFSQRWGFGRLTVVNLFGLRATDPKELLLVDDPTGSDNLSHVSSALSAADLTVVAWGASKRPPNDVRAFLVERHEALACLGTTKSGEPRHPLYVSYTTPLTPWKEVN